MQFQGTGLVNSDYFANLTASMNGLLNNFTSEASSIVAAASDNLSGAVATITTSNLNGIASGISTAATNVSANVTSFIGGSTGTAINTQISSAVSTFTTQADGIIAGLPTTITPADATSIADQINMAAAAFVGSMTTVTSSITGAISGINAEILTNQLTNLTSSFSSLTNYAASQVGSNNTNPGLGIFGLNGNNPTEMVASLQTLTSSLQGGFQDLVTQASTDIQAQVSVIRTAISELAPITTLPTNLPSVIAWITAFAGPQIAAYNNCVTQLTGMLSAAGSFTSAINDAVSQIQSTIGTLNSQFPAAGLSITITVPVIS